MNVSIGKKFEELVNSLVHEGRYASASEVIREGLRLVQEREAKLASLRETINRSIARGGSLAVDEVEGHMKKNFDELEAKA